MNFSKIAKLSECKRKLRRKWLRNLLKQIMEGEFYIPEIDPNKLYLLQKSVRHEYQSPQQNSGYNWGYMTSAEMNAGNEEAW